MANPQPTPLRLNTTDAYFLNSGDSRLVITGRQPTIIVTEAVSPIKKPGTGSISFTGNEPTPLPRIISPGTGTLTFSSIRPSVAAIVVTAGNPDALVTTGYAPTVLNSRVIGVPRRTLSITGQPAYRFTGLWFESDALTVQIEHNRDLSLGSMAFASEAPQVVEQGPAAIKRVPPTGKLTTSGYAPGFSWSIRVTVGNMDLTGKIPLANNGPIASTTTGSLGFTGKRFSVDSYQGVIVTVTTGAKGTIIINNNATTDVPKNYQIDDRTGFKVKVNKPLIEEYTGVLTRPDSLDRRSEQEFMRARPEHPRGAKNPEPVNNERFIEDEYPNGVTPDDL